MTQTRAVVWARCSDANVVHLLTTGVDGSRVATEAKTVATRDSTVHIELAGLHPGTRYQYELWCGNAAKPNAGAARGSFQTPATGDVAGPVRFVWSGDLGGQKACRDVKEGYPIFDTIRQRQPDFFIALGDMIYADDDCPATSSYRNEQIPGPPRAFDRPSFWAKWKYNRADAHQQQLLAATPMYAVYDDHEVRNDAGPTEDTDEAGRHLFAPGVKAFGDYNPLRDGAPFFRNVRWGKHLEVFFLDTRSFRDPNAMIDSPDHPKTMLGPAQRQWLLDGLANSDATWKVIVTSVPLSIPTGGRLHGRDGWANFDTTTGFEQELLAIVRFLRDHKINNTVWLSTDVHYTAVTRYQPFDDAPWFHFLELEVGPLQAGVYPGHEWDDTLKPQRLLTYPAFKAGVDFEEAKTWFTFGEMRIDAVGNAFIEVRNTSGEVKYVTELQPESAAVLPR